MAIFTDQCGREVNLSPAPGRIVSTVPSISELLADLELESQVVGITAYCVHPRHWLQEKTVIGGTKDLNLDKIRQLRPDLIIANKEENVKEQVEKLWDDFPVWLTEVVSVDDALDMIEDIGTITGRRDQGQQMLEDVRDMLGRFRPASRPLRAATLIWKEPYMAVSGDTYIHSMMELLGLENLFRSHQERYPAVSLEELSELQPDILLLSSEPYAFNGLDISLLKSHLPHTRMRIVDGEHLSWYGSHLIKALPHLLRMQDDLDLVFRYL